MGPLTAARMRTEAPLRVARARENTLRSSVADFRVHSFHSPAKTPRVPFITVYLWLRQNEARLGFSMTRKAVKHRSGTPIGTQMHGSNDTFACAAIQSRNRDTIREAEKPRIHLLHLSFPISNPFGWGVGLRFFHDLQETLDEPFGPIFVQGSTLPEDLAQSGDNGRSRQSSYYRSGPGRRVVGTSRYDEIECIEREFGPVDPTQLNVTLFICCWVTTHELD